MSETQQEASREQHRPARGKLGARAAAVVILAGAVVVLVDAISIALDGGIGPQQSGFFPMIVGLGLIIFGLAFLVRTTVWPDPVLMEHVSEEHREIHWVTLWLGVAGLVAYALLLDPLGYIIATFLFILALAWVTGSRHWIRDILVGILFPTAVYFGFTELLGVRLPAGLLEAVL